MENVLVTGGCGFIGSRIVDKLINQKYNVFVIDNLSSGSKENIDIEKVHFYETDINDKAIEKIFQEHKFKYVIHQAAQTSVPFSVENLTVDTKINILGSVNLIDLAQKYGVEKFVFASSAAIYGNPEELPVRENTNAKPASPYGLSKFTIEEYLKLAYNLYNLNYTILRYSNVFGPKQTALGEGGVVSIFNQHFIKGKAPIIFGDGNQTRDFIYVDDVADANIASLKSPNGIFNISSNKQTTINHLYNYFCEMYGTNYNPIYQPSREGDIKDSVLSNQLALRELDWNPKVSLEEGLKNIVKG